MVFLAGTLIGTEPSLIQYYNAMGNGQGVGREERVLLTTQ